MRGRWGVGDDYESFVAGKSRSVSFGGIPCKADDLLEYGSNDGHRMFPHQRDVTAWALKRGRAALFLSTGLGKTICQLVWADRVCAHTDSRTLLLAPLAVSDQTVREAARWNIGGVAYHRSQAEADAAGTRIVVTNYEMLEHFDAAAFVAVVADESSRLKDENSATRNLMIETFAATPYRLCCSATPAPNDYTELGNHSEFLGIKSRTEMMAEYFVHDGGSTQDWRIKGHAEGAYWSWVVGWGAVVRMPSDLGYDDGAFELPPLRMHEKIVPVEHRDAWASGLLFAPDATTLSDQRATRRMTMARRVEMAAALAAGDEPVVIWAELNDEADALTKMIPGAVQVAGSDSIEDKKLRLLGFADGVHRVLVTKPKCASHGLNWQHCNRMIFVGASNSFEQTYQAIRRCWRFGQARPVDVFVLRAETEGAIVDNYNRKAADAERMGSEMAALMREAMVAEIRGASREWSGLAPTQMVRLPEWLKRGAA
jgi:hypothetical protein